MLTIICGKLWGGRWDQAVEFLCKQAAFAYSHLGLPHVLLTHRLTCSACANFSVCSKAMQKSFFVQKGWKLLSQANSDNHNVHIGKWPFFLLLYCTLKNQILWIYSVWTFLNLWLQRKHTDWSRLDLGVYLWCHVHVVLGMGALLIMWFVKIHFSSIFL